jgi:hypothetical protein
MPFRDNCDLGGPTMFTYPTFDVEIVRKIDPQRLGWPGRGEADHESGLGCNRMYMDLRGLSWTEAERVFALEQNLIARIESAVAPEQEYQTLEDELFDGDEDLLGLDLGVASAVVFHWPPRSVSPLVAATEVRLEVHIMRFIHL